MNITIIGTGYVGLVTGVGLAEVGNSVTCVDIDKEKIDKLNKGISPIYEPGLDYYLTENIKAGRLSFTTSLKEALSKRPQVLFITVGTPPKKDNPREPDLTYIYKVAEDIGNTITEENKDLIVVTKSTVPPGTTYKVREIIMKLSPIQDIHFANNPEFLKEGDAIADFLKPDRIILGIDPPTPTPNTQYPTPNTQHPTPNTYSFIFSTLKQLYSPFSRTKDKLIVMSIPSSELTKYAANSMLALRISFMNELSRLTEKLGADIEDIRRGISTDPRIGPKFLYAGIGYGGSCFPKDVNALIDIFYKNNLKPHIVESIDTINKTQREYFLNKILTYFKENIQGKSFTIWGLSFKPNTDDIREAPSIYIIEHLLKHNAHIKAYDPKAIPNMKKLFPEGRYNITYYNDQYTPLKDSDALILLTEWLQFREPDFTLIRKSLNTPIIFDARNQYNPHHMKQLGIEYVSVGR